MLWPTAMAATAKAGRRIDMPPSGGLCKSGDRPGVYKAQRGCMWLVICQRLRAAYHLFISLCTFCLSGPGIGQTDRG